MNKNAHEGGVNLRALASAATLLAMLSVVGCQSPGQGYEEAEGFLSKRARIEGAIAQEWAATHDPRTLDVPRERLVKGRAEVEAMVRSGRAVNALEWIERGPSGVGGRTRALLFDRNDPSGETVWAGGVSGGLWKTTQISAEDPQWVRLDDFFENLAVSCLLQDPQSPDTLFFGTGEGWFNHDAVRGLGIWRTTDGGQSWQQLPSTATPDFYYVMDMAFDAAGRLLVATRHAGLLRSSDGGETWIPVLSPITDPVPHTSAADIEVAANGDIFVTFGLYRQQGVVYRSRYSTNGPATGDPGTWEDITPPGSWERMELASAPSDASRLYLLAQGEGTTKVTGCFRSFDGGDTWEALANIPVQVGQAWYNLIAQVDPLDPDLWFLGAIRLYRSADAGQSWQQLEPIHPDHHAIVFDPAVPGRAILGNDGGVYLCPDLAAVSPQLLDRNSGYNVTQFYGAAIHPDPGVDVIFGGTQDNGTLRLTEPGLNGKDQLLQGDGGLAYYDILQPDLQIGSVLYNRYFITNDNWGSSTLVNMGFSGRFINPSDYDSEGKTLYSGDDAGRYRRWLEVDLCQSAGCSESVEVVAFDSAEVTSVRIDPHRAGAVYFGLRSGRVVRVLAAAGDAAPEGQWLNAGSQIPEGWISCIATDPLDSMHLIVTLSNYGLPSVWETTDGGQTWTDIENNLPDLPVRWAAFQPGQSSRIVLATDLGVWMCDQLAGVETLWMPAGNGLANTRVDMLQFRTADHMLVAATHGRGIFTTDYFRRPALSFSTPLLQTQEAFTAHPPMQALTCGDSAHQVTAAVVALPSPQDTIAVAVQVVPGSTAREGRDVVLLDSFVYFGPGLSDTQRFSLLIVQDGVLEGDESMLLQLSWADTVDVSEGAFPVLEIQVQDDEWEPDTFSVAIEGSVGAGTDVLAGVPFSNGSEDTRVQMLYRAAELEAAGLEPGSISQCGFQLIQANGTGWFQNATLRMKNTSIAELGPAFEGGLDEVFSGTLQLAQGWNTVDLSNPFYWNGQNLLVEWCVDNPAGIISSEDVFGASVTSSPSCLTFAGTGLSGCPSATPDIMLSVRPDIRLMARREVRVCQSEGAEAQVWLDAGEVAHFTDQEGDLLASIQAAEAACYTVELLRAGSDTLVPSALSPEAVFRKSWRIETEAVEPFVATLYFGGSVFRDRPQGVDPLFVLRTDTVPELTDLTQIEPFLLSAADSFGNAPVYRFTAEVSGSGVFSLATGMPGVLAIGEISLSGRVEGTEAVLEWDWPDREEVYRWVVERGADPGQFYEVATVFENVGGPLYWRGVQPAAAHPFWYYRVTAEQADGTRYTSDVVALPTEGIRISLFPSPADDEFSVCMPSTLLGGEALTCEVLDLSGRIIDQWLQGTACQNRPATALRSGLYFLRVKRGEEPLQVLKFLVDH